MNVREAKALLERMREAKEASDRAFNAAYEELGAAIRPHAMHETNQVVIKIDEPAGYSATELSLVKALGAANVFHRAVEVARYDVMRASMGLPARMETA